MAEGSGRVVLGAPLFNHARELEAALDSVLAQTHREFALVLVDDASTDETAQLAADYARRDPRVTFTRNPRRLGMVANWRRAYELARERVPEAAYFAWVSDHDHWEPAWLERMVEAMDSHPEAVLAYSRSLRIRDDGSLGGGPRELDTVGLSSAGARIGRVGRGASPGWMVYGLIRASALERAGVFRTVLQPDRLLVAELAAQGEFRQVDETLWHRRYQGLAGVRRQRRTLFADRPPWHARLPSLPTHAAILLRSHGAGIAAGYVGARAARAGTKARHRARHRSKEARSRLRHTRHALARRRRRAWRSLRILAGRVAGRG